MFVYEDEKQVWLRGVLERHLPQARLKLEALRERCVLNPETGCLTTPTKKPSKIRIAGGQIEAYRLTYCVEHGEALAWEDVVRHRCHNRLCINPEHLTRGDRRDNKHDDWEYAAEGLDHFL